MIRKSPFITFLALLYLSTFYTPISFAQEIHNRSFALPNGAKARIGNGRIRDVVYSKDGRQLVVASSVGVWVYDAVTHIPLRLMKWHTKSVKALAVDTKNNSILSVDDENTLYFMYLSNGSLYRYTIGAIASKVAISPTRDVFAVNGSDGVKLYHVHLRTEQTKFDLEKEQGQRSHIWDMAFSPNEPILAAAESSSKIALWNKDTGVFIQDLIGHGSDVKSVVFSPDGSTLISGSADKTIRLWDMATRQQKQMLSGDMERVNDVAINVFGSLIAAGCVDGSIHIWDVKTGKHDKTLVGHTGSVLAVTFNPHLPILASCSTDGTLQIWDISTGEKIHTFADNYGEFTSFTVSPDRNTIATPSEDKNIYLWDATTGAYQKTLNRENINEPLFETLNIAYNPNAKTIATRDYPSGISIWDLDSGKQKQLMDKDDVKSPILNWSPEGDILAIAGSENTLQLWDTEADGQSRTVNIPMGAVIDFAYGTDGQTAASVAENMTYYLWDVKTGEEKCVIHLNEAERVYDELLSPDGKTFAIAWTLADVHLYDVDTGEVKTVLNTDVYYISCIAFSPDGRLLAVGTTEGNVIVMDIGTNKVLHEFHVGIGGKKVHRVGFATDMETVVSLSGSGIMYLWDLAAR